MRFKRGRVKSRRMAWANWDDPACATIGSLFLVNITHASHSQAIDRADRMLNAH